MQATGDNAFWWRNAAVWLTYLVVSTVLGIGYVGQWSGMLLISASVGVWLFITSAAIRFHALRAGWLQHDALALGWRLLLAVLVGSTVVQLGTALLLLPALQWEWVRLPGQRADYRPFALVGYWLNSAIMLAAWCALWAGRRALLRARHSELAQLRAEAQRVTLEHQALRARLNPHFVFNALNNLRALIHEDPARARDMVTHLSGTLRHALTHTDGGWVALAEEWRVVQDYLAVEAIHYEARLRVRVDIETAALAARLPPMALQLLVENAIKHGIAVTCGGGELQIAARLGAGQLHLQVRNPVGTAVPGEGHGVGLAYLRAQLGIGDGQAASAQGRLQLLREGDAMLAQLEVRQ
ncbi:sensor histidine kinase [Stenotrophomonas sp. GZD-301]|uniref:sensor histidine kinase n=1 Tax=Stenotrophomonas sp. GZD-301 TaxID=3404814 RepID=UPI003BB72C02